MYRIKGNENVTFKIDFSFYYYWKKCIIDSGCVEFYQKFLIEYFLLKNSTNSVKKWDNNEFCNLSKR